MDFALLSTLYNYLLSKKLSYKQIFNCSIFYNINWGMYQWQIALSVGLSWPMLHWLSALRTSCLFTTRYLCANLLNTSKKHAIFHIFLATLFSFFIPCISVYFCVFSVYFRISELLYLLRCHLSFMYLKVYISHKFIYSQLMTFACTFSTII